MNDPLTCKEEILNHTSGKPVLLALKNVGVCENYLQSFTRYECSLSKRALNLYCEAVLLSNKYFWC